jgi:protein SCO1/2
MQGFVRIFCIFINSAALLSARAYDADGLVVSVHEKSVVVAHRPIKGLMPAMTMEFAVRDSNELKSLRPGARIRFELDVRSKGSFAQKIQLIAPGEDDMPAPARSLVIGQQAPAFVLMDQNRRKVSTETLAGRLTLVNFIYTRCPLPNVCPRLAASFASVHRRFGSKVLLLSITVDPVHDTPEVLARYSKLWRADGEHWRFLTGTPERVARTAANFGLVYWPEEGAVAHTSRTVLIGRDSTVVAVLEGSAFRTDQLISLVEHHLEAR